MDWPWSVPCTSNRGRGKKSACTVSRVDVYRTCVEPNKIAVPWRHEECFTVGDTNASLRTPLNYIFGIRARRQLHP